MADVIQKIFDIQLNYDGVAQKLSDLTEKNAELSKSEADLKKQFKDGTITAAQYAKSLAPITQEKKRNAEAIGKYTQAFQQEIKSHADEIASVTKLQTRLESLSKDYNALSETGKRSVFGKSVKKEIDDLANQIRVSTERIAQQSVAFEKSSTSISGLKSRLADLKTMYENLSRAERNGVQGEELRSEIQKVTKEYNTQIDILKKSTSGIDQNSNSVNALRERLKTLIAQYDELDKKTRNSEGGKFLRDDIQKTRKEIQKAEEATGRYSRNVGNYMSALKGIGMRSLNIVAGVTTVAQAFVKLGNAFKQGIQDAILFNREISKLTAITQDSTNNIGMLVAEAKRLGSTTRYTATEVAQLQVELAKLGYTKSEILVMSESVLNLAQATGSSLADAASLAGAALRVFGDDATQLTKYVDQMATATSKSALSFDYIKTALPIVGGAADMFGFDIQDTLALLGQLANSGMEASMAATATRNIFLKLADSSGVLNQQLGKPVESLDDLLSGLEELRAKGANLNDALEMTNVRSAVAFTRFMNSTQAARELSKSMDYASISEEDLRKKADEAGISLQELRKQMEICNGTAKDMAKTMEDNLGGEITRLSSAWDDYMLSLQKGQGALKWAVEKVRELVTYLGDIARTVDESENQQTSKALQNYLNTDAFKSSVDNDMKIYEGIRDRLIKGGMDATKAMTEAQVQTLAYIDNNTNNVLTSMADSYKKVLDKQREDMEEYSDMSYEQLVRSRNNLEQDLSNYQNKHVGTIKQSRIKEYNEEINRVNGLIDAWDKYSIAQAKVEAQENRKNAFSNRANANEDKSGLGIEDDSKRNKRLQREKSAAKALLEAQIAFENAELKIRRESAKKQQEALDNQYKHEIERLKYKIDEELKMRGDESEKERAQKLAAIDYYNKTIADKRIEWSQQTARLTYEWTDKEYQYTKELYDLQLAALGKNNRDEEMFIKRKYDMRRDLLQKEEENEIAQLELQATKDEMIEEQKQIRLTAIRQKYAHKRKEIGAQEREDVADVRIRNLQADSLSQPTDIMKKLKNDIDIAITEYNKLISDKGMDTKHDVMSESEWVVAEKQAYNEILAAQDAFVQKKIELSTQQLEIEELIRQTAKENEFGNNERIANEVERSRTEVEIARTKYEEIANLGRMNLETEQEFQLRKAQAYNEYVQKREALMQKELDIVNAVTSATVGGWAKVAQAIADASEENKNAAKVAKAIGLAEIWINNGIAIAKAVKTQSDGDPYTMFARIAAAIAEVMAGTITAVSQLNKAKFAKGVVNLQGAGTTTSDSIPARLSRGESVMTAKATKMFGSLLTIMNDVAAQPSVTLPTQYSSYNPVQANATTEAMTDSMREAVSEIHPVVAVTDINDANERVNKIMVLDTF